PDNGARRGPEAIVDHIERGWLERRPIEGAVDVEGLADQAWARAPADPRARLERAHQHCLRAARRLGAEVQAVWHAVTEVAVSQARWSVHDLVSRRQAAPGMGRTIFGATVGLDLDQPAPVQVVVGLPHEQLADEVLCNLQGVAREEAGSQHLTGRLCSIWPH